MKKVFKGIEIVSEDSFEAEDGKMYLVNPTGDTDNGGYIQMDGYKFGNSLDLESRVNEIDEVTAAALVDLDTRLTEGLGGIETLLSQI